MLLAGGTRDYRVAAGVMARMRQMPLPCMQLLGFARVNFFLPPAVVDGAPLLCEVAVVYR